MILACGSCAAGMQAVLFPPVGIWALIACLWFVSVAGRKRIVALFAAAVVCLSVTAGVTYWRVSRMTPTQRVQRVANTPGADVEIARLARAQADPLEDYREILATTDSPRVAEAIGRQLVCLPQDADCARVLVDLLQRVRSQCDADALQKKLRETTGMELPSNATAKNWREKLTQIDTQNQSTITPQPR